MRLYSLFPTRRAPRQRQRRQFTPTLDGLEGRQLMDGAAFSGGMIVFKSGTSVIGGQFDVQFVKPNGTPYAPGEVKWVEFTIENAYDPTSQVGSAFGKPSDYFSYKPFGTKLGDVNNEVKGFWDGTPGTHKITIDYQLANPTYQGLPIPVNQPREIVESTNVTGVKATMVPKFNEQTLTPYADGSADVTTGEGMINGISLAVKATFPKGVLGSFGVVQTYDSLLVRKFVTDTSDVITQQGFLQPWGGIVRQDPPTLLDRSGGETTPFYGFGPLNPYKPTARGGTTAYLKDSPTEPIAPGVVDQTAKTTYVDTLFVRPDGGLFVPVGNFVWTMDSSVTRNPDGNLSFTNNAHGPRREKDFVLGDFGDYPQFPAWQGWGTDYIDPRRSGDGIQWVDVTNKFVMTDDIPNPVTNDVPLVVLPPLIQPPTFVASRSNPPDEIDDGSDQTENWDDAPDMLPLTPTVIVPDQIEPSVIADGGYTDPLTGSWIPHAPATTPPPVTTPPPTADPVAPAPAPVTTAPTPPPGYPAFDRWGNPYGSKNYCVSIATPTWGGGDMA